MAQWIPLHSQGKQEVLMHFKTFLSVFPHAIAWMPVANEILVIGSDRPIDIDFEKLKGVFRSNCESRYAGDPGSRCFFISQ